MRCPKCRDETLEKVNRRAGSTVDPGELPYRCSRCGGLFVDVDYAPRLLEESGLVADIPTVEEAEAEELEMLDRRAGLCPKGHGIMGRVRVEVDDGFYLDRCIKCRAVWFDPGEWEKLARRELLHRIPDFWTAAWQRHQRQVRQREEYLGWIEQELGPELVDRLDSLAEILREHPQRSAAVTYLLQESRLRAPVPNQGE